MKGGGSANESLAGREMTLTSRAVDVKVVLRARDERLSPGGDILGEALAPNEEMEGKTRLDVNIASHFASVLLALHR
jgi:hypothetical protein